jgi:acetyltransferase
MKKPVQKPAESVHDFLQQRSSGLDMFFAPTSVAVIGATETVGSVGRTLLKNLIASPFGGTVYPVNPKRPSVLGIKSYPQIGDITEKVDLAVIVTPAASVPGLVKECAAAGVRGAIIISAGFKETGAAGIELERQVLAEARKANIRLIGPNCLGVMNPINGFNATFAASLARPGSVAFISQSGALLTAILDWSIREMIGFSAFVSIGSMLDVGWGDLIDYLGDDPKTQSIVIYMESIGDARAFLSAAREVALTKPIIVIKAGRTEGAAKAAASHTGSLTGSDDVLDAAFRRAGVLRVNRIADLFDMAEVLSMQPRPKGNRLTIITNAGGPGVLATDALLQTGGELAIVSKPTLETLNTFLPAAWSHNNPIDVLGDAGADRYAKTLEAVARDPNSDGVLVILTPQDMTDATGTAEILKAYAKLDGKPLLASWMGGENVEEGSRILKKYQIPEFAFPDAAARVFTYMCQYSRNLAALYETPEPASIAAEGTDFPARTEALIAKVRAAGRTLLNEIEAKELLALYGIPVTPTRMAKTEAEAVKQANRIGYPVVLKLYSETITHKTDVGGVQLNIRSAPGVRTAFKAIFKSVKEKVGVQAFQGVTIQPMISLKDTYELILGSSPDPQFGPTLLFGTGGQLVEIFKDRALALPPLNTTLARRMMEGTQIYAALKGTRGRKSVDLKALEQLLVRFSQLVLSHRDIREIDINPLLASADGLMAVDARVVLYDPKVPAADRPRPAIRPYPAAYIGGWRMPDKTTVVIRPIRHQDEPLMAQFHKTLSERSVYLRYFQELKLDERVKHERLTRRCFIDYEREMALVAEGKPRRGAPAEILGIARYTKKHGTPEAEFALLVSDQKQRQGLGRELLQRLIQIAREERIGRLTADILRENHGMLALCKSLGFATLGGIQDAVVKARLDLM